MKRVRTWIVLLVSVAMLAGGAYLISLLNISVRVLAPAGEPPSAPSSTDPISMWIGWGLVALAASAVAFTAWAIAKQIRLIRRGRPNSR